MANKEGHRKFGNIRQLPSGRYQASYLGPDNLRRNADYTFETEKEASDWLTLREAELLRGEWNDPVLGRIKLREYGEQWIEERTLAERTREQYRWLMSAHRAPAR